MRFLGPKEREVLPYVLVVLAAFLLGLGFLVFAVMTGP
jgi:cytoskeletal protein RodZ